MRTTNFVCLLAASISTTATVDAIAIAQLQQMPSELAQADADAEGFLGGSWGWGSKPNCLNEIEEVKGYAEKLSTEIETNRNMNVFYSWDHEDVRKELVATK